MTAASSPGFDGEGLPPDLSDADPALLNRLARFLLENPEFGAGCQQQTRNGDVDQREAPMEAAAPPAPDAVPKPGWIGRRRLVLWRLAISLLVCLPIGSLLIIVEAPRRDTGIKPPTEAIAGDRVSAADEYEPLTLQPASPAEAAYSPQVIAEAAVEGRPPTEPTQQSNAAADQPAPIPPSPALDLGRYAEQIAFLIARGDALVQMRDIVSARLYYERAAEAGDGRAALRMGETFDPAFLGQAGIRGVQGDPNLAVEWYRRSRNLGDADAARLLERTGPRRSRTGQ